MLEKCQISMFFTSNQYLAPMAIEKITALPIQPIYLEIGPSGLNWQCCFADRFKTVPRILIFLIAMGANSSY
jgi:hypothetical protein